jgi:RNA polymerase sigma-70 factor (ECF subfamily)
LQEGERRRFEQAMLPHLDAAYNLARWLTRKDHDAEDVVQEAYLRAWKSFAGFRGGDGKAWLLATVRNTCYTWLAKNRAHPAETPYQESMHGQATAADNPAQLALREEDIALVHEAIAALPVEFREVIVLRDLEGLSYHDIAGVAGLPLGTVMSRLARARERLQPMLAGHLKKE